MDVKLEVPKTSSMVELHNILLKNTSNFYHISIPILPLYENIVLNKSTQVIHIPKFVIQLNIHVVIHG